MLDCNSPNDITSCNQDDPPTQDIDIETAIVHPDYNNLRALNDIALLRLKHEPILLNIRNILTICLPVHSHQLIENVEENGSVPNLIVSGWGQTETSTRLSDVLMQATVPYVPLEECAERFSSYHKKLNKLEIFRINENHLVDIKVKNFLKSFTINFQCAGGFNRTDSCNGDSGSPIFYPAMIADGKYRMFQYGVVSIGLNCSDHEILPGAYTSVSKYMPWILDNLSK